MGQKKVGSSVTTIAEPMGSPVAPIMNNDSVSGISVTEDVPISTPTVSTISSYKSSTAKSTKRSTTTK